MLQQSHPGLVLTAAPAAHGQLSDVKFVVPLGVLKPSGGRPAAGGGAQPTFAPAKSQRVEGRVTRLLYVAPADPLDKRFRPEGDAYVSVHVATNRATHHKETQDQPVILLDVVDAVPIETAGRRTGASSWCSSDRLDDGGRVPSGIMPRLHVAD